MEKAEISFSHRKKLKFLVQETGVPGGSTDKKHVFTFFGSNVARAMHVDII